MAKHVNRNTRTIIIAVVFICAAILSFVLRKWFLTNPFEHYTLTEVSGASADSDGNIYIITDSGTAILKVSPEGKLLWKISASEDTFENAYDVVADDKGNVYVHDVRIKQGIRIDHESVIKLSSDGHFVSNIQSFYSYDNNLREKIAGLVPKEEGVFFIEKQANRILLFDSESPSRELFSYVNADKIVSYADYDVNDNVIYLTEYDGDVVRVPEKGERKVIYDSDSLDGSIPCDISVYNDKVYVTDIGLRNTIIMDKNGKIEDTMDVGLPFEEKCIEYYVNAGPGVITSTAYYINKWDGHEYEELSSFDYSKLLMLQIIAEWVAFLIMVLSFIYLVVFAFKYFFVKASVYIKLAISVFFIGIAVATLILGTTLPDFKDQMMNEVYNREQLAATAVSHNLPIKEFLNLTKPSDFMNDDYKKVSKSVNDVFITNNDKADDLYCVLYRIIDDTVTLTYTLEDICVVYPYDWGYEGTQMQDVVEKQTTAEFATNTNSGSFVFVHSPIINEKGVTVGVIEVGTDMRSVNERTEKMVTTLLINVLAIMVVFSMLAFELLYFVKGMRNYNRNKLDGVDKPIPVEIFRFIVFIIFFFTNLTYAIFPIHAMEVAKQTSISFISPVIMAAIPVSAEVASGAVFSAIGGGIINKIGTKKSVLISSILFSLGLFLRVVPNIWVITLGSIMLGMGWGILLLLVNIMIAQQPGDDKNKGFAYYSVSLFSGSNCGIVFGAFLLQWFSHTTVFLIAAVFSIVLYFVVRVFIVKDVEEQKKDKTKGKITLLEFIRKPQVIIFFLFMMAPFMICGYYVNYMFPIVGSEWGLSDTYIGYAFILNGLVVMLFGTTLTGLFAEKRKKKYGLVIAVFLYAVAFLNIAMMQNITSLLIALVIIGVADSFGVPLLTSYFTDLHEVEDFGYEKSFGVYSLVENAAQSLGSFVFGYAILIGVGKGLMIILTAVCIMAVIFLVSSSVRSRYKSGRRR